MERQQQGQGRQQQGPRLPGGNAQARRRVTLAGATGGRARGPRRYFFYGGPGIGKSTLANGSGGIFIDPEKSTEEIDVAARFPAPPDGKWTWQDVLDATEEMIDGEHDHAYVIYDTLDKIEGLIWQAVCAKNSWENIESPGFGKGFTVALDEWRKWLQRLDVLIQTRGVGVVFVAHSTVKAVNDPRGAYDRHQPRLNPQAAGLINDWCSLVAFCEIEHVVRKVGVRNVAATTGARIMHLEPSGSWYAKSRFAVPPRLPMSWPDLEAAIEAGQPGTPAWLRREIDDLLDELQYAEAKDADFRRRVAALGDDAVRLARAADYLRAQLGIAQRNGDLAAPADGGGK